MGLPWAPPVHGQQFRPCPPRFCLQAGYRNGVPVQNRGPLHRPGCAVSHPAYRLDPAVGHLGQPNRPAVYRQGLAVCRRRRPAYPKGLLAYRLALVVWPKGQPKRPASCRLGRAVGHLGQPAYPKGRLQCASPSSGCPQGSGLGLLSGFPALLAWLSRLVTVCPPAWPPSTLAPPGLALSVPGGTVRPWGSPLRLGQPSLSPPPFSTTRQRIASQRSYRGQPTPRRWGTLPASR